MTTEIKHKIYFVRHGQCAGNVSGVTLPPDEDVITDFGRAQAAALGQHLKDVHFTRAIASNYQRAIETAKGILAGSVKPCPLPLEQEARIREREMGSMVGLPAKEVVKRTIEKLKEGKKYNEIEIPGGETLAQYVGRIKEFMKDFLAELRTSSSPQTILVVSHGLYMRRLLVGLQDSTLADICEVTNWSESCKYAPENTSCTIFSVEYPSEASLPLITFDQVHCREHLKSLKQEEQPKSSFNISSEERKHLFEEVMKIPGAKEELSGCIQV